MAATLASFTMTPSYHQQCGDPDFDSLLDFSQIPSPTPTGARMHQSPAHSSTASPTNTIVPLDQPEDLQTPAKPSHEYERFKQQTGLPTNSVPGLSQQFSHSYAFSNSGTGIDEMALMGSSSMIDAGWNSGLGMGTDVNMDLDLSMSTGMPPFFYPGDSSLSDDYVDPSALNTQEDTMANVRVWPGMHQQQAALAAKAQAQAQQQRQQQIAQQQQQQKAQQQQLQPSRRNGSHQSTDQHTEEAIGRLLQRMRQQSTLSSQDGMSPSNSQPHHHSRTKKEEEDMDEDERLLASEEGKKLSSKERRQLRNKVSARAFRSRRKEYIGDLEKQLDAQAQETNQIRMQNKALLEENAMQRNFIETLLRHKAFVPYLDEISQQAPLPVDAKPAPISHTPTPKPTRKDVNPYASQQYQDMSQNDGPQIGMALVPETPLDMSMLNLGNNNWMMQNSFNYQPTQIFAVTELPEGPADPIDAEFLSGKGGESFMSQVAPVDEVKPDYPVIERPMEHSDATAAVEVEAEEDDDEFDLYAAPRKSTTVAATLEDSEPIFGDADPEKVFAHFELFISDDAESERLMERFEKMCARLEPSFQAIEAMTSFLDL